MAEVHSQSFDAASQRVTNIHKEYEGIYAIIAGLGLVVIGIWIGSLFFTDGYNTNVYTELLSVVATIVVVDQLNRRRAREELKNRLFNELRSPATGQGTAALAWLRREGWLDKDIFKGLDLYRVNWENAYLGELNLEEASLSGANLKGANNVRLDENKEEITPEISFQETDLYRANLENAELYDTSFYGTCLIKANLQHSQFVGVSFRVASADNADFRSSVFLNVDFSGAKLMYADFSGAGFFSVDFKYAYMRSVNLLGAYLADTNIEEATLPDAILPNGEKWSSTIDMEKFTNSSHPEFKETREKIDAIRKGMGLGPVDSL